MTEIELRNKYVNEACNYVGIKSGSTEHHKLMAIYNTINPLPRGVKMTTSLAWCAAFVSAIGKACNLDDIILPECGCTSMIKLYQKAGLFIENDAYIPNVGDLIFYDWADDGKGDCNNGYSDHVGIVKTVTKSYMLIIEGNMGEGKVGIRKIDINGRYIRGFATPNYKKKADKNGKYKTVGDTNVYKRITTLPADAVVYVKDIKGNLAYIEYYGGVGYTSLSNLKEV